MHARGGLKTAYLSERWMECVNASLDEAQKWGMDGWLYDENGWPSGFGGGLISGLGEKFQQKYLRFEVIDAIGAELLPHTIAFYKSDGATLLSQLPDAGKVMRAFYELNPFYVDNMDPKVVAEFIRSTHQYYYETIPENLRSILKGVFTDEPQLSRNGLPWSLTLPEKFKENFGSDLLSELPKMQYDLPGFEAFRIKFWKLCAELFNEHFMKQIHDHCDRYGWKLTGHHVLEETCEYQIPANGSIMLQYQHYHLPGMDCLCRRDPNVVAMIQLVSAATQFGHRQLLTESFALTGWGFGFREMRWMYNQQLGHGVNLLCQHLESYSLRGARKRDYPGSHFIHQPWWEDYSVFNDYAARCGMLLSEGQIITRVAVYHPLSSAWKYSVGRYDTEAVKFYTRALLKISDELTAAQINHHYIDELIAEQCAFVKGKMLHVGACAYDFVILPQLSNLSEKMLLLLQQYTANGGKIIRIANRMEYDDLTIDGLAIDSQSRKWFDNIPVFNSEIEAATHLTQAGKMVVKIHADGVAARGFITAVRDFTDLGGYAGKIYFITSKEYVIAQNVQLEIPGKNAHLVDPLTGEISPLSNVERNDQGWLRLRKNFSPGEEMILFVSDEVLPGEFVAIRKTDCKVTKSMDGEWELAMSTANLLLLDHCSFRYADQNWQYDDVSTIQVALLNYGKCCDLEMVFDFNVDSSLALGQDIYMVMENPEKFSIELNEEKISNLDCGMLFDQAFRKVKLPNIRHGQNTIKLGTNYRQSPETYAQLAKARIFESEYNKLTFDSEIENIYLAGDFGVSHQGKTRPLKFNLPQSIPCNTEALRMDGGFTLSALPKRLNIDNIPAGKFPFFAGKIILSKKIELSGEEVKSIHKLQFKLSGANSCRVFINGQSAGICFWAPFEVATGNLLHVGENEIQLQLTISLRNLLGPHHNPEGDSFSVHTFSWQKGQNILNRPAPGYTEAYCLAKVGVENLVLTD